MPKVLIALIVIGLAGFFAFQDSVAPPKGMISTHKPAPVKTVTNASFTDIKGNSYTLHEYKGRIIILNFWATWCPPCIIEFPKLLELANREQDNITLITLSVDDNPADIMKFLKTLPAESQAHLTLGNVIIGLDTDKSISREIFKTTMYPETFIIDKNLTIKHKIEGITDWLGIDVQRLLK
ncbi:MAG: hypothetical protein COB14_06345 [Alphaproteobacteria bacterium]|nr:MAG: hypothetical protein COB14_06345 [Alphaproteobacteria bacterium]